MPDKLVLEFGALCPKPTAQIDVQGLVIGGIQGDALDTMSRGITMAAVHGILTERETDKARQRLIKWAGKRVYVKPAPTPAKPKKGRKK